jgi:energy-coupling factor transporter ATP-binding protein EcfA2
MFNICPACGEYSVEKVIEQDGPEAVAVCPSCHHAAPFLRLPLFVVTGASGAGKSTVCQQLIGMLRGQCGLPVVLCGTAVPVQVEPCPERRYFSALHYLALVCDDDDLQERLTSRPAWRQSHTDSFVEQMVAFNRWLKEHAALTVPPLTLHDTSHSGAAESTRIAAQWIQERLPAAEV